MARWAWWLLLTSVFTVLTAGAGIYYVRETLVEARAASGIALKAMIADQRPWIEIEKVRLDASDKVRVLGSQGAQCQ